ncbi:alpha/beta hydrolase [Stenotrophomonas sp. PS02289]|uniref:alpha/beta fold hydrolase n=1 Tax=Stenotrophomonas sp. PS02289 TaxID=2991422 RepID=UPI00249AA189|nr:alpha/beta hydrolase [Stenotrophomonas sp. PS02289]
MLINTPQSGAINVVRTGKRGTTVLFLHPVGLDGSWFDNQISAFRNEYDVVTMDMPGHGLSSPLVQEPTFAQLADTVAFALSALDINAVHVVGLSFGGMIAQHLALRHPNLVKSLLLIGTTHTATSVRDALKQRSATALKQGMAGIVAPTIERWFGPGFGSKRPDVINRAAICLLRQEALAHSLTWSMVADLDLTHEIGSVSCPVLVVGGDADVNTPYSVVQGMARALGGVPVEMMEGVGHFPPIEAPEAFNQILDGFLKGTPARTPPSA